MTNIFLSMAMSADGFIAKENDDTPWSDEVWNDYYELVKRTRCLIVGRRTYEIMKEVKEFDKLGDAVIAVVSRSLRADSDPRILFASSPREAVEILQSKGFTEIPVGGGAMLNASFLKEGLLDEIYLDVEPMIFGKGIRLFGDTEIEAPLKLSELKNLSKNTVQLHYQVLKK